MVKIRMNRVTRFLFASFHFLRFVIFWKKFWKDPLLLRIEETDTGVKNENDTHTPSENHKKKKNP